jgi:hypothetical protein
MSKPALAAVLAEYPIAHELEGWFFRLERLSARHWRARGIDLAGRQVSCEGQNEDVLYECVSRAKGMPREGGR